MKDVQVKIEVITYAKSQPGKYVVILGDDSGRKLPIVVCTEDAQDLSLVINNPNMMPSCVRLLTTMVEICSTLEKEPLLIDTAIEKLVVYDCQMGLFKNKLYFTNGTIVEMKLGYGLIIAATFKCPIYITQNVMDKCAVTSEDVEDIKKVEMDIFDRIDEKLKTSAACQFKTGKQSKRIDGDWEIRYEWELFDANDKRICGSEWEGFESLEEALEDMLTHIK